MAYENSIGKRLRTFFFFSFFNLLFIFLANALTYKITNFSRIISFLIELFKSFFFIYRNIYYIKTKYCNVSFSITHS